MDRMRESMFAILGDLNGRSFLDLYAGSGVVGVEAASRGASPIVFVEKDFGKKSVLQRNLSFVRESTQLQLMPAERFLRRCKSRFDVIFLDPPYGQKGTQEVMQVIVDRRLLTPGGTLVLHAPREQSAPERLGDLEQRDCRRYGRAMLRFYGWKGDRE
jgi:16S rRNA (guanine966-N2)-methyltransferase